MESRDSNDSQSEMISNFDSGSESDEYKDTQILRAGEDKATNHTYVRVLSIYVIYFSFHV